MKRRRTFLSLLLAGALLSACGGPPPETKGHARLQQEQALIKQERELQQKVAQATGAEKTALEKELSAVSSKLDEMGEAKQERQERRAAEKKRREVEEQAAKKKEREEKGYVDDPKIHREAEAIIKAAGFSCPGVASVRKMGDRGRGMVLRAQCRNNVFFGITILPQDRGFSVDLWKA